MPIVAQLLPKLLDSSYLILQNVDTAQHIEFLNFALASVRALVWSIFEIISVMSRGELEWNAFATITEKIIWRNLRLFCVGLWKGGFLFLCIVGMCCDRICDSVKDTFSVKPSRLGLGTHPPTRLRELGGAIAGGRVGMSWAYPTIFLPLQDNHFLYQGTKKVP